MTDQSLLVRSPPSGRPRHRKRRRSRLPLFAALVLVVMVGSVIAIPDSGHLWRADFGNGPRLVTNEVAHREPERDGVHVSEEWVVTSGSLFAEDGVASTGPVDGDSPDVDSRNATGSAVLRAVTVRNDFADVRVSLDLQVDFLTATARTGSRNFDGVHLLLRYVDPDRLYTVDLCRRDGVVTIKRKSPRSGSEASGVYVTLGSVSFDCVHDSWRDFVAETRNEAGGVRLTLSTPRGVVLTVLDRGAGGYRPLTMAGRVGIRGDNAGFHFRDFVVQRAP